MVAEQRLKSSEDASNVRTWKYHWNWNAIALAVYKNNRCLGMMKNGLSDTDGMLLWNVDESVTINRGTPPNRGRAMIN